MEDMDVEETTPDFRDLVRQTGAKQAGWTKKSADPTTRPHRSYGSQRQTQILRQYSTQLFFYAKKNKGTNASPQEVEAMYAAGNVFIGTNADAEAEKILQIASMQTVLEDTTGGQYSKSGKVTRRHSRKFKKWYTGARSFSGASDIFNIIKAGGLTKLKLWVKSDVTNAFTQTGKTFVVVAGQDGRHAEEKLMDLLAKAGHTGTAIVAGKKRPCGTCLGRMTYMKNNGYDVRFNPRPGLIWKERLEDQPDEVQKVSLSELQSRQQYRSEIGQGYGSESDSDRE
jgi:hypothetical protein